MQKGTQEKLMILKRKRHLYASIDARVLDESSDLLGYRFSFNDCLAALLTAGVACFLRTTQYTSDATLLGAVIGSLFTANVYLIFKSALPLLLFVRVVDMLRHRVAFSIICAAGALGLSLTASYQYVFSGLSLASVVALLMTAPILLIMRFIRHGERALLALAYGLTGALTPFSLFGVFSLLTVFITFHAIGIKLARMTVDDQAGETTSHYLTQYARKLTGNILIARNSRILCGMSFLIGFTLVTLFLRLHVHADQSMSAVARAMINSYSAAGRTLTAVPTVAYIAVGVLMIVFALVFIRRATDIFMRLPGNLMTLYAAIIFLMLTYDSGILLRFADVARHASTRFALLASFLAFGAFVLSSSVFIIELGSREYRYSIPAEEDGVRIRTHLASRRLRWWRTFLFALAILGLTIAAPLVLAVT